MTLAHAKTRTRSPTFTAYTTFLTQLVRGRPQIFGGKCQLLSDKNTHFVPQPHLNHTDQVTYSGYLHLLAVSKHFAGHSPPPSCTGRTYQRESWMKTGDRKYKYATRRTSQEWPREGGRKRERDVHPQMGFVVPSCGHARWTALSVLSWHGVFASVLGYGVIDIVWAAGARDKSRVILL